MKVDSSVVTMSSYRHYTAEAEESQKTISRQYQGGTLQKAAAYTSQMKISQFEVEGGTTLYTTSSAGVSKTEEGNASYQYRDENPIKQENNGSAGLLFPTVGTTGNQSWLKNLSDVQESAEIKLLKRMLELLKRFSGKSGQIYDPSFALKTIKAAENSVKFSASASSIRVEEAVAVINGQTSAASAGQSAGSNGIWTRQTDVSGFIAGQETMAFSSTGSVVTSDGRSIDFNITMEMSRSFAAAYQITGKETIYTDPLVINMDTDRAQLDDVTFYFDLDADGTAEEIAGLSQFSGLLAFDRNNDGTINDGSELFGAMTGDGFKELAQYDEDGNGWIDENDSIFDKLSVWVKCGTAEAELISLKEADVGAIFLGSQSTNYTLTNSSGEEGAKVRQTGIYLKESGQVGTVQHLDFKA